MGTIVEFPDIDPADAAIGARLKRWREARGVEVSILAECLQLSCEATRRVEAGRGHLDSAQIAAATSCLRLPLWALVSDRRAH